MFAYYLLYPLVWLFGHLPRFVQRGLDGFVYFLLYKCIKYRVDVVRENLSYAFAEKSEAERLDIERKFYRHLASVFVETLVLMRLNKKSVAKRIKFLNYKEIEELTKGKSWISAMGHYGSWELTTTWGLYSSHDKTYAVYRPLHSKTFDKMFNKMRSRFGVEPLAMDNVVRTIYDHKKSGENITIAMIADQTAPGIKGQYWTEFMGRMAPFFNGVEKMAVKFKMPVAFLDVDKLPNGRYEARFELIYDGEESVESGEVTQRYVDKLEALLNRRPELWMWSHRRWKHKYNPNNE